MTAIDRAMATQTLADNACADLSDADLADLRDLVVSELTDPWWRKHLGMRTARNCKRLRVLIMQRLITGAK